MAKKKAKKRMPVKLGAIPAAIVIDALSSLAASLRDLQGDLVALVARLDQAPRETTPPAAPAPEPANDPA